MHKRLLCPTANQSSLSVMRFMFQNSRDMFHGLRTLSYPPTLPTCTFLN
jgi:hypothetical protein